MNDQDTHVDFSFVLASSVHDMKNSVGMLLQTLEAINNGLPPENQLAAEQLGILGYEASRINVELVQLLALYRMQQERMPVQIDEHYLIDLLAEQTGRNELMLRSREIQLECYCDEELVWFFDVELLGGVVNNLLVNAARYCRRQVNVTATLVDDALCLEIADDGAGFPQKMLDAPFETHAGVSFTTGSTNLGLLFAQQVARLHRRGDLCGRIELANGGVLGGGQIRIILP